MGHVDVVTVAEAESSIGSIPTIHSSVRPMGAGSCEESGSLTPPHQAMASVPFRWEEQPGKPRPHSCSTAARRSLMLPPRLLTEMKKPKTASPATVLGGQYFSPSFRFRSELLGGGDRSGKGRIRTAVLGGKERRERRLLWGCWGWKSFLRMGSTANTTATSRSCRDSCIFSSSVDIVGDDEATAVKGTRIGAAKPDLWASICEGLRQVIPWRKCGSIKMKHDGIQQ